VALQAAVGNRAVAGWLGRGPAVVQRQKPLPDPIIKSEHRHLPVVPVGSRYRRATKLTDDAPFTLGDEATTSADRVVDKVERRKVDGEAGWIVYSGASKKHIWVPDSIIEKRKSSWQAKTGPLFRQVAGKDYIMESDVKQGKLGDCYLEAAAAAIARTDPGHISGMFTDHGTTVTVRLYRVHRKGKGDPTFTAENVTVDKSIAADPVGEALYDSGRLWVQMLEKAYVAGGFAGTPDADAQARRATVKSMDVIAGGYGDHALEVLLGRPGRSLDLSSGPAQVGGGMGLPWSDYELKLWKAGGAWARPALLATQAFVTAGATEPRLGAMVDTWMQWVESTGAKAMKKLYEEKKGGKYVEEIRLEDVLGRLFPLPNDIRSAMRSYLAHQFPGRRVTGQHTDRQLEMFTSLEKALAANKIVTAQTHAVVGRKPEAERGKSAGESQSKGLVGSHVYTVIEAQDQAGRKQVLLRNPWGETGRAYDPATGSATTTTAGVFSIDLADFTKRFVNISVA